MSLRLSAIIIIATFASSIVAKRTAFSASFSSKHLVRSTQALVPSYRSYRLAVSQDGDMESPPSRVLFVGNSLTYVNNVDQWVLRLRESSGGPPVEVATCVKGGASLKRMWQKTKAKREIAEGGFDVVVLQEDLPETTVDLFHNFCRKFVTAARDANATPLLHQTWAYQRLPEMTNEDIRSAHQHISLELGVKIADVGSARMQVAQEMPHLNLWAEDLEHPSELGAYLAALVLYRALFKEPTLGIAHRPEDLADEDATLLQKIVDEFSEEAH